MNSIVASLLLALVLAVSCQAFAPSGSSNRAAMTTSTSLFDSNPNAMYRGGKRSWEFELETMYVEEPKKKVVVKKNVPKKPVAKKPAFKSSAFNRFGATAKKPVAKKETKMANPFAALPKK